MHRGASMPLWVYTTPPAPLAVLMVVAILAIAMVGLVLVHRYLLPRLHSHDGVNDAVSGAVEAIGVGFFVSFEYIRLHTLLIALIAGIFGIALFNSLSTTVHSSVTVAPAPLPIN